MRTSPKVILTLVVTTVVTGLIGLATYLALQGLERADQLSSAMGLFVGIAGLALTIVAVWLAWIAVRNPHNDSVAPGRDRSGTAKFNVVAGRDAYTARDMTVHHKHQDVDSNDRGRSDE
jgi:hypothetical protein